MIVRTPEGLCVCATLAIMIAAGNVVVAAPENDLKVERIHLSPDGTSYAVLRKGVDGFQVQIDGTKLGPFLDTDLVDLSPFRRRSDIYSFRALKADGVVLVVQGKEYGPFQQVWGTIICGAKWASLVKSNNRYRILANGTLSEDFDEFAGDHQRQDFDIHIQFEADVPLFYGDQQWAAFARNGEDRFIVTDRQKFGPFTAIGDLEFGGTEPPEFPPVLNRCICLDQSTLAIGVSKKSGNSEYSHHLWINGVEKGPFPELPEFTALRDMSADGKTWAFRSPDAVHTNKGSTARLRPSFPMVSTTGSKILYTYGDDGDMRIVIGDEELGPFAVALSPGVARDGKRWIAGFKAKQDSKWYVQTESGRSGPYLMVAYTAFQGNQALAQVSKTSGTVVAIIDGMEFGTYTELQVYGLNLGGKLDQSADSSWAAFGLRENHEIDIFDSGTHLGKTGPFDSLSILRAKSGHWSAMGRVGDQRFVVEDGIKSKPFGPFKRFLRHDRSPDNRRLAVLIQDIDDKHVVVLREKILGPYAGRPGQVVFSSSNAHWAFQVRTDKGKYRVVHDMAESPEYDAIISAPVADRGAAFVGVDQRQTLCSCRVSTTWSV